MRLPSKLSWYAVCLSAAIVLPALVCQTLWPIISPSLWEELSEDVYATLLRWQGVAKAQNSRVAVIEADHQTTEALGWPIDRQHYIKALAKLKANGHPWVVSLLQLQALSRATTDPQLKASRAAADTALVGAIKAYGRYIGTGLVIKPGAELEAQQEDLQMPRITLSRSGAPPVNLPRLPLELMEEERFVSSEATFGYGTHFGLEPVVRCMQMYLTDQAQRGEFVILSSLVWGAAFANQVKIMTGTGAGWPRRGDQAPAPMPGTLQVAYKECMNSPSTLTTAYLESRHIERHSLLELLGPEKGPDLRGKVVILAGSDMRRYRGPGHARPGDDGIVEEPLLAARLLDGLIAGTTVHREPLGSRPWMAALPLILGGVLLVAAQFVAPVMTMALPLASLLGLLVYSYISLAGGDYVVPVQGMAAAALTLLGIAAVYAYLRYHSAKRQIAFSSNLRQSLSVCNTLTELEVSARKVCKEEFAGCEVAFAEFDRQLYDASTDPAAALQLLDRQQHSAPPHRYDQAASMMTQNIRKLAKRQVPFASHQVRLTLPITSELGKLGALRIAVHSYPYDADCTTELLDILVLETTQHWHRIKRLVDQKILDYRMLREKSRGEIMGRFLSKALVAKFSDERTMEENLRLVLTPRPTKAALFQADVRGYSKLSATMQPEEMVRLLQNYFRQVVDEAQQVAQVKLIGDCIFLFIEEDAARPGTTTTDLALELAGVLIRETTAQNALRPSADEHLNFGIAVHYGEVVVGNLSSDSCIDYTVIGPNVNLVARLEELTKNLGIQREIGKNGVILSKAAVASLERYRDASFTDIALAKVGVKVRSFDEVTQVVGLKASEAALVGGGHQHAVATVVAFPAPASALSAAAGHSGTVGRLKLPKSKT